MILYYAPGDGLGHISRAKKIITQLKVKDYKVVTTSSSAKHFFPSDNLVVLSKDAVTNCFDLKQRLEHIIEDHAPETIFIDAFPAGIVGELNHLTLPDNIERIHIARLLKWNAYKKNISDIRPFHKTYAIEDIDREHHDFIVQNSVSVEKLAINPHQNNGKWCDPAEKYDIDRHAGFWVIVHSSSEAELRALINYASDMCETENIATTFIVITDIPIELPHPHRCLFHVPASDFFPKAEKIISACGFNIMQETQAYKKKHHFIPFDRKYDDQFTRARMRRKNLGQ